MKPTKTMIMTWNICTAMNMLMSMFMAIMTIMTIMTTAARLIITGTAMSTAIPTNTEEWLRSGKFWSRQS